MPSRSGVQSDAQHHAQPGNEAGVIDMRGPSRFRRIVADTGLLLLAIECLHRPVYIEHPFLGQQGLTAYFGGIAIIMCT